MKGYKDYISVESNSNIDKFNFLSYYLIRNGCLTNYTNLIDRKIFKLYIIPHNIKIPKEFKRQNKLTNNILLNASGTKFQIDCKYATILRSENEFIISINGLKSIVKKTDKAGFTKSENLTIDGKVTNSIINKWE